MSHYVIGDVQGCYDELVALCTKVKFDPQKDKLIFAGDLVNRGPKSLEVLNFCIENRKSVKAVLGNHDFYLLYLIGKAKAKSKSTRRLLETTKRGLRELPTRTHSTPWGLFGRAVRYS